MIEYIKGSLDELTPTTAIVEVAGIGYQIGISLNTYTTIQGKNLVKLFVYEVIREDAHLLYGFATKSERELFTLLVSVSGVGGQMARMMLSAFTPVELGNVIRDENVSMLKKVKGIGPKVAQRVVVELKDKVALDFGVSAGGNSSASAIGAAARETVEEVVAALTTLGFPPAASQKVALQIVKDAPDTTVEAVIKQALKML